MELDTDPRSLVALAITFLVLDVTAVVLRFYTRYVQRRSLAPDDLLMIPALVRL